jgi:methylamine utilization protein MauJ
VNAISPFYRFLAYWNCLEATFDVNRLRNLNSFQTFLNQAAPQFRWRWDSRFPFPRNPWERLWEESRSAVAHVIRDPGRRRASPNSNRDRERFEEANWLRHIARLAVKQKYSKPVTLRYATD